ncbi:malate synthase A [Tersicoccus phoenicis]|uniref:Malate synthase n=1 Tax=Tersicoccus phoenicis TaxID=554083 RepID=A0A1R1LHK4_9MICC|nr:malate synthase A [Tersicoccus phoenicis]OMH26996.1 malate synthase A [Tersicoccus phoenicis]
MNHISTEGCIINGVTLLAPSIRREEEVLTADALRFVAALHRATCARRDELLEARRTRRRSIALGKDPAYRTDTAHVRADTTWRVAPPAPDLTDRRVEITTPVDRASTVTALTSGANVWLADLEDASVPTWENVITGQLNLNDGLRGAIPELDSGTVPDGPRPTVIVRPRGLHLPEKHLQIAGRPVWGGLVDLALYLFHNAQHLISHGSGPYFYLPKIESAEEARLWNDVFVLAQKLLGIPRGTIRATVLVETITAAFEMDEILYELREHAAGLNAGRWDYVFSMIKNFRQRGPRFILPDRERVSMSQPFMRAFTEQLVAVAHRRGTHAIGGLSTVIPVTEHAGENDRALARVVRDKEREAEAGFDGSWVAHPGLVMRCRAVFDVALGEAPNQLDRLREDVEFSDRALLDVAATTGSITEDGILVNLRIGLRYLESWLRGTGAVAVGNRMEDLGTAEISRAQLWQWIHCEALTKDGEIVTAEYVERLLDEEFDGLERTDGDRFDEAREILERSSLRAEFPDFLTSIAYAEYLCRRTRPWRWVEEELAERVPA